MLWNSVVPILAGVTQLVASYLGYRVSVRPIPNWDHKKHRVFEWTFIVCGIVGAFAIISGAITLNKDISELKTGVNKANQGIGIILQHEGTPINPIESPKAPAPTTAQKKPTQPREQSPSPESGRSDRYSLLEQNKDKLKEMLSSSSADVGSVALTCQIGDGEGCRFAYEVIAILKNAGWTADGVEQAIFSTPINGILIQVKSVNTPGAGRLQQAFKSIGIEADGALNEKIADGRIGLVIGFEPH